MSNKRIGCENFGKFYTEGKVRNRREWRGVTDTLYDYSRWLHNWITMAKMVSKPRNIKAMFRYRWMANYLAVPMMVDRHTQGLRDEYLRICHLEQDLIIEDVAKLLDGLFRRPPHRQGQEILRQGRARGRKRDDRRHDGLPDAQGPEP